MNGLVFKFNGVLIAREIEDIQEDFKNQLDRNGFIVVDDRFDIYEIKTENTLKGAANND